MGDLIERWHQATDKEKITFSLIVGTFLLGGVAAGLLSNPDFTLSYPRAWVMGAIGLFLYFMAFKVWASGGKPDA